MESRIYFGRPVYMEGNSLALQFNGMSHLVRLSTSATVSIAFNSKLFAQLNSHSTSGILINSVNIEQIKGIKKEIFVIYNLTYVTVDNIHIDRYSGQMQIELSFKNMTYKLA